MSSTGSLRRTDVRTAFGRVAGRITERGIATTIATIVFFLLMISFRPFQPASPTETGGDIVNQLGFGSLGGAALFALFTFVDRRTLVGLLSPWWLLLLGFLLLSVVNALDPPSAGRTAIFTLIGIIAVCAVLTVPRDADAFSTVLVVAGGSAVALCYIGLVIYPGVAIHGADGFEPQHAGFWRGAFSHKNIAGPVMACLAFAGIYLWRRHWHLSGALLGCAALFFMANTGSKTTLGLIPLAFLLVMTPRLLGLAALMPLVFGLTALVTTVGTVGMIFLPGLKELALNAGMDATFTGRTTLWEFIVEMLARRPWTGYGYESFWGTPLVVFTDKSFDMDWNIGGIVHGHNGYLDIAITMGIPALVVSIITFWIVPLRDYVRTPALKENVYRADLFMMMLIFTSLNAFLESFFFRRVDPVWLFFVMALFGLRMTARFPIPTNTAARR